MKSFTCKVIFAFLASMNLLYGAQTLAPIYSYLLDNGSSTSDAPVLLFSDMKNAPKTGWSVSEPDKGASITLWGRDLGDVRGNSYVSVNGVKLTHESDYAVWGAYWPTPFYQKITFWLNSQMRDGAGEIRVTVNGKTSNALPFRIREGRIFFVSNETNGDGSLENPFKNSELTKWGVLQFGLKEGDILYYRGKSYTEAQYGANSFIRINDPDNKLNLSEDKPFSLIAYPGERPHITYGDNAYGAAFKSQIKYSVFSGFEVETEYTSIGMSHWGRVIGNDLVGLVKTSNSGTAIVTTSGNGNKIFGNAIHGGRSGWRLDHGTYFSGCADIEGNYLGWNYVYDNDFGRGPELSVNHQEDRCAPNTQILKSHFIFSNIVDCMPQRATVINVYDLSYDPGEEEPEPIFIYNNIFANCGTLDFNDTDNVGWAPASITQPSRGHSRFYNNTFYNMHYVGFQVGSGELSSYFRNNIMVMNSSGVLADSRAHQYVINGNRGKSNTVISDNLFYDIGANTMNLADLDTATNVEGQNPLFVNPSDFDFNLKKESPAINAGVNDLIFEVQAPAFAPVSKDIFGRERSGKYDLGAVESRF